MVFSGIVIPLYIGEFFKRREIPPAHDIGCQFGLIPIDRSHVQNVEEGVGVEIPLSASTRNIVTAKQIILNTDPRAPSVINNTAPTDLTTST